MRGYQDDPRRTTWRASAECPRCAAPIVLRERRRDGHTFVSCSAYPDCRWSESRDAVIAGLAAELGAAEREIEALQEVAECRQYASGEMLARDLRRLIYAWHPDRHPEPIPPHEVVSELTRLRGELRERAEAA